MMIMLMQQHIVGRRKIGRCTGAIIMAEILIFQTHMAIQQAVAFPELPVHLLPSFAYK